MRSPARRTALGKIARREGRGPSRFMSEQSRYSPVGVEAKNTQLTFPQRGLYGAAQAGVASGHSLVTNEAPPREDPFYE